MKQHKHLAAALACALAVSLGAGAVLATESAVPEGHDTLLIAPNPTAAPPILIAPNPSTAQPVDSELIPEDIVEEAPAPDAEGTVSFANLESRMRTGYYSLLALEETLNSLRVIDYDKIMRKTFKPCCTCKCGRIDIGVWIEESDIFQIFAISECKITDSLKRFGKNNFCYISVAA